ncbi:FtsQ-type POTRA domain-containing protein [Romboutsia ilealis]|uniref:FtsQ-type POTRA domain-containing protein n=1 Tax=Romboutsia faecis TaxID=2764597 RepID=A0ABR7JM22_9FIRM|nr:FtsQ-type POTRA domain-containing protein [Romboutsia faecis]MBC5995954.1 FtsQ-type POTRA domain-containing protein [Romboutsia faecis]MRN23154.1 FtsQ-type POTRA domain-containing protein [Romboutsia ilealis]
MKGRKKKKRTDRVIIALVFVFMLSLGTIAFLKSNIFNLSKVEIIGNKNLKENEVVDLESLMTNKNIFTYNLKKIKTKIVENPYVEDAQVKIKLPNKIIIDVDEVDVVALLSNGKDYCYIDNEGNLIKKIDNIEENSDKIIFSTEYSIENGQVINFKSEKDKKAILNLISTLRKEHLEKEIVRVEYTNDSKFNIESKIGAKFLLINDDDLNYNIARASKILLDLQNKNINSGVVDLTYNNYAVYKPS